MRLSTLQGTSGRFPLRGAVALLLACLLVSTARAESDAVRRGGELYRAVCMMCHARDPMTDRPQGAAHVESGVHRAIETISPMRWLEQRLDAAEISDIQAWLDFVVLRRGGVRPETGWYWDPAQPGRGYFFEYGLGYASLAAYFYADSGRADWALGNVRYDGSEPSAAVDLLTFIDGPAFGQPVWREPSPGTLRATRLLVESPVRLRLELSDGNQLVMSRLAFDLGSVAAPAAPGMPESGWWWDPAEPGSGFAIEVQRRQLFVVAYTYDALGQPTWLSAFGEINTAAIFEGTWQAFANGQHLEGPYRPADELSTSPGELRIEFTTARTARLRYPDGREVTIERFY